jgi:translation initiation factor RLI1
MVLKGDAKINIDSIVLALLYRVYGNITILVSLSNLLSSSISSKRNLKHSLDPLQETRFPCFNESYISATKNAVNVKGSTIGGYEIRGSSGVGKTLTIERMVSYYRAEGYRVFVWMNSIDFPDIFVHEYIEEVLTLKKNQLKNELSEFIDLLPLNVKFSSLSLGQKSRLGILLSASIDVDIVFIDEPFANLDTTNVKQYKEVLLELSTVRKVIITNHGIKINEFTLLKFE